MDAVAPARAPIRPGPTLSRRLQDWGLLLGVVGAVIGFIVGWAIGSVAIAYSLGEDNSLGSDPGILLGYSLGVVGFLAGMGFLNYPIGRLLGRPKPTEEENAYLHGENGGLLRYFRLTTDHKVIGMQYLMMILAFLFIGGLGAMFIRSELLTPVPSVATPQSSGARVVGACALSAGWICVMIFNWMLSVVSGAPLVILTCFSVFPGFSAKAAYRDAGWILPCQSAD